ncbi:hypothetical protein IM40_01765 [Candidatus Paracaedimonas acanthamoebae]|nr:hypothetical protein IM40_01765 [Candidatus Paracaedimonas acanthamoebae]
MILECEDIVLSFLGQQEKQRLVIGKILRLLESLSCYSRAGGDPGNTGGYRMTMGKIFRSLEILGTGPRMTRVEGFVSHR